jgi:hypothetical protein
MVIFLDNVILQKIERFLRMKMWNVVVHVTCTYVHRYPVLENKTVKKKGFRRASSTAFPWGW